INSLGKGVGLELTGKSFSRKTGIISLAMIPKVQLYTVTATDNSRGSILNANLAVHSMFKKELITINPGVVRLPDGKTLVGGSLNFALPRGLSVFAAAPTNLPMKYRDVLPGAHPKPGAVEFGVGKGPFQFGAGSGKEGVYGLLRVSLKPLQIGNRELHPQAD